MKNAEVVVLIAVILLIQAVLWLLIARWVKGKTQRLMQNMYERCRRENTGFIIEPQSGLYRGSDSQFGNVKGNGAICLTEHALLFEKIMGQRIEISRTELVDATVEDRFKGNPSIATGGKHLVIKTRDGNRIGFLLSNAELWAERLKS